MGVTKWPTQACTIPRGISYSHCTWSGSEASPKMGAKQYMGTISLVKGLVSRVLWDKHHSTWHWCVACNQCNSCFDLAYSRGLPWGRKETRLFNAAAVVVGAGNGPGPCGCSSWIERVIAGALPMPLLLGKGQFAWAWWWIHLGKRKRWHLGCGGSASTPLDGPCLNVGMSSGWILTRGLSLYPLDNHDS